jgi:hypothetical protein
MITTLFESLNIEYLYEFLKIAIYVSAVVILGWIGKKLMDYLGGIVFMVIGTILSLWHSGNSYILEKIFRKIF